MRSIMIGTDEAGYGPNLGPLVVSVTVWEADWESMILLPERLRKENIPIDDSKKLYHGKSLKTLESGLFAAQRLLQNDRLKKDETSSWETTTKKLREILQQLNIRLVDMRYQSLEPKEFNELLDQFGSKGTLLSNITLRLIAEQLKSLTKQQKEIPIIALLDKHGGRNRYLDLLTSHFPQLTIQTIEESRKSSIYRLYAETLYADGLHSKGTSGEFRFLAKGESHVPIALASMLSKYQRELKMIEFNQFWLSHIPGLKPTAGYPEDAKRFKRDIAIVQEKLGIPDEVLWRKK